MFNKIIKYIKREIFSYVGIERTIEITKISRKYINDLEIKDKINMINFCKIYYQNDNRPPSLYILLRHFITKLSKRDFMEIYVYFMNNYIKNNPNELIELELLLDIDIIETIINKTLLKTNRLSLKISSLNFLLNKNINFKNNKNIEQIYFNFPFPEKEYSSQYYNKLYIKDKPYYLVYYLLVIKLFGKLIPKNIKKIGFPSIYINDIPKEKIIKILRKQNIYIDENNINKSLINLIFDELSQYKNIKNFEFPFSRNELSNFLEIIKNNHPFINNLDEIELGINLYNEEDITLFKELINKNDLKNKLKINILVNINDFEKIKSSFDTVKYANVSINVPSEYELINTSLPKNLKNLNFDRLYASNIFTQLSNLEILDLYKVESGVNSDFESFRYLTNLKDLRIIKLYVKDDDELNNLFSIFNKYNHELVSLEICKFENKKMLNFKEKEIKLYTHLELKNLKKFIFKYQDEQEKYYYNNFKINSFNIDKCEKLEEIRVPFYFECNNTNVLNNIKKISISLLETNNIEFLNLILRCNNLRELFISFLLPFQDYNIINTLYKKIGKIRRIECMIVLNVIGNLNSEEVIFDEKEEKKMNDEYIRELNNIIKVKKLGWNYLEEFYVLPSNDDYKNFENMKYNEKIEFLKNFPVITKYGDILIENEYLHEKINYSEESKLFLDNFGLNKTEV